MNKYISLFTLTCWVSILIILVSCSSNDSDGNDMGTPPNNQGNPPPIDSGGGSDTNLLPDTVYNLGNFTASLLVDTDLDGDLDLILGPHIGLSSDMLLINDGSGKYDVQPNAFPTRYKGENANTVCIVSADFNNDGLVDIITSTIDANEGSFSESSQIHLYLNNGNNTFSDGTSKINDNLIQIGWVEWLRIGDYNNDGFLDFLTTAAGGYGMDPANGVLQGGFIYLNDGTANFSRTLINMNDFGDLGAYTDEVLVWDEFHNGEPRKGRYPLDILVGDIDNDGDIDAVATNGYADGQWPSFINVSTGTDASFEVYLNGMRNNDPYDVVRFANGALLDINGDGFLDLIGSSSISGNPDMGVELYTYLNDGTGKFIEANGLITGTAPTVEHARQWLVNDFNNDGISDLFIADHGYDYSPFPGSPNVLLIGNGSTLVNNSNWVGTANNFTHGGTVGDINADGSIDIFMNNIRGLENIGGAASDYFLYFNNGSGNFSGKN